MTTGSQMSPEVCAAFEALRASIGRALAKKGEKLFEAHLNNGDDTMSFLASIAAVLADAMNAAVAPLVINGEGPIRISRLLLNRALDICQELEKADAGGEH